MHLWQCIYGSKIRMLAAKFILEKAPLDQFTTVDGSNYGGIRQMKKTGTERWL